MGCRIILYDHDVAWCCVVLRDAVCCIDIPKVAGMLLG